MRVAAVATHTTATIGSSIAGATGIDGFRGDEDIQPFDRETSELGSFLFMRGGAETVFEDGGGAYLDSICGS